MVLYIRKSVKTAIVALAPLWRNVHLWRLLWRYVWCRNLLCSTFINFFYALVSCLFLGFIWRFFISLLSRLLIVVSTWNKRQNCFTTHFLDSHNLFFVHFITLLPRFVDYFNNGGSVLQTYVVNCKFGFRLDVFLHILFFNHLLQLNFFNHLLRVLLIDSILLRNRWLSCSIFAV